jgi:hypothetical protein
VLLTNMNCSLSFQVYDPTKNTWATPFSLSEDQGVSDLGAFANGNDIYIVGGLNKRFAPEKKVWKINGSNLVSLQITSMANLSQARGGIQAYTNGEGFAYVAGGVDSCPRLDSVEKYDIVGDSWSDESPLQNYRSDMALTSFDGRLLAIGGEAAFDDGCNGGDSVTGETTKVVNDVELLNDLGVWEMVPPIPVASFRFGGVYFAGKTYVFGGQVGYNADCQCYKTTDQVLILESSGTPATDAPTVSPDALEPPTFCFSGDSIVEVLKKGFVAMKDLSLGDMVKVAGGKFSEVYSFGHYDQHQMADYLSIDAGLDSKLTLSPDHMVFVENKAVPASLVSVGDKLTLVDGSAVVKSIKEVVRTGAFAPFTKDGTIVVNNVVASSYISLQSDSSQLEIGGVKTFGMHPVAHFFQAPHRIVCELQPSYCTTETYINGISAWVETPLRLFKWLLRQNTLVRGVGLFSAFTLGLVFVVVESLIVNPFLLFCAFAAGVMWTRIAGKKKRKSVAPL